MQVKLITILCLMALGLAAGCKPGNGSETKDGTEKAVTKAPGIEFTRLSVGLPTATLDFIGPQASALAGARTGNKIFFGVTDQNTTTIYSRDLASNERRVAAVLEDYEPGSLITCDDGHYLGYVRMRDISKVIDDPATRDPQQIAVVYRYDVAKQKEEQLVNFNDEAWRAYRSDKLSPMISPDGSRIAAITANLDSVIVRSMTMDWLANEADYTKRYSKLSAEERKTTEDYVRKLYGQPLIQPYLREAGVTLPATGKLTDAERKFVKGVYDKLAHYDYVLLLWEKGQAQLLHLTMPEGYRDSQFEVAAVGQREVVLRLHELAQSALSPVLLFKVDLASGQVSTFGNFTGAPSTMILDSQEQAMLVAFNPLDVKNKALLSETHLLRLPLDGSASSDVKLPADYVGYVDVSPDGKSLAGQNRLDNGLYLIDPAQGSATLLCQMLSDVDGIFLTSDAKYIVFLENGVTFKLAVQPNPEQSPDWTGAGYFEPYHGKATAFLTHMGFTLPVELDLRYEERKGMGAHEISVEITDPAKSTVPVLMRYSVPDDHVAAVWFPWGYPFPIDPGLSGTKVDYYAARDIADKLLNRLGWLNPDTREIFQPHTDPMFSKDTDSWIFYYRDGYWLGEPNKSQWVYNKEVSLRVGQSNGVVPELTYSALPEVKNQPIKLKVEDAVFQARNYKEQPIPEKAPVEFDAENYRMAVVYKTQEKKGPGAYQIDLEPRLCFEINVYLMPEHELVYIYRVDAETGEVMSTLKYLPPSLNDKDVKF